MDAVTRSRFWATDSSDSEDEMCVSPPPKEFWTDSEASDPEPMFEGGCHSPAFDQSTLPCKPRALTHRQFRALRAAKTRSLSTTDRKTQGVLKAVSNELLSCDLRPVGNELFCRYLYQILQERLNAVADPGTSAFHNYAYEAATSINSFLTQALNLVFRYTRIQRPLYLNANHIVLGDDTGGRHIGKISDVMGAIVNPETGVFVGQYAMRNGQVHQGTFFPEGIACGCRLSSVLNRRISIVTRNTTELCSVVFRKKPFFVEIYLRAQGIAAASAFPLFHLTHWDGTGHLNYLPGLSLSSLVAKRMVGSRKDSDVKYEFDETVILEVGGYFKGRGFPQKGMYLSLKRGMYLAIRADYQAALPRSVAAA
ncbi:MAG: hypothetical protein MRY21_01560 [Simkaniaceae bacterium]|nr:hypothetical protein [Simkaniaceae bacterium]